VHRFDGIRTRPPDRASGLPKHGIIKPIRKIQNSPDPGSVTKLDQHEAEIKHATVS
jgi:hypothetical protein